MIRILLDIEHQSPFLRTFSGKVIVEYLNYANLDTSIKPKLLLECRFDYKPGQKGFKSLEGFKSYIFNGIKPQLDVMIESYAAGMNLAAHNFSWVQDSHDKPLEEWLKEKEIEYEASDEFQYTRSEKFSARPSS